MRHVLQRSWLLFGLLAALAGSAIAAPRAGSPVGDWLTGQGGAVVHIAPCADGGGLCGRIVAVVLNQGTAMPSDYRGRPQCGFELIRPSARRGSLWRGGIVDPRNGKRYHAQFHVDRAGELALRGYLGLPIFGETRHWLRYRGPLPASCRIDQTQVAATLRNDGAARQD